MTEPENFDDELFADLYNDDEPAGQPARAPETDKTQSTEQTAQASSHVNGNDTGQQADQNGGDDGDEEEEEDDDDDIDFNLGNVPTTALSTQHDRQASHESQEQHEDKPTPSAAPAPAAPARGPNAKEDGKMFIGGLNWETTDQSLRDYFSQFGEVVECTVMRDSATGRSRGFGFLTFKDPKTVNIVMVKEHYLDGKIIDPKRAIPRDEQEKTSKIFVGGVSQETTDHEFREYFSQFGRVVDATLMMDKDTGRPRGFGFVTFESEAGVEACLAANLELHGKPIEVKKAQPRGNLRDDDDANRRGGKFGRKGQMGGMDDNSGQSGMNNMMGGGMGPGAAGMSPQLMAQYLQRMQQAMAMFQQQMMMTRNMNPAMMQQMMYMQQMQQMMAGAGRGGPMPPGMNPAMMQQQMAQMQQMMNQQGGGPGMGMNQGGMNQGPGGPSGPGGPNGNGPNGPGGGPGGYNNAYDQQQFDQQQGMGGHQGGPSGPGGGRRGGRGDMMHHHHGGFNQGGGYMGGGGGGPTSWEGMYDDVPQPMMNQGPGGPGGPGGFGGPGGGGRGGFHKGHRGPPQIPQGPVDPANAPPANAPTGPKNAGRPGANYRGGGRGGNRGFHPYARS
ncbi:hypothetical protein VTJ04DRAFT_8114 [Mycothermus thermophilus]|uniref:uncharacterized protein n=1 Tax=Humicola insolens TaxID=85995 RepID=UPI0037426F7A